jgi:oligopeptide/dipeptide ABC transporter ATP-binding protein
MQMIFQDPMTSLDPRFRVGELVAEGMESFGIGGSAAERIARVQSLLAKVKLEPEHLNRYPHEFSGGQRQRLGLARALAVEPELIICDEAVSALDVSIQAQMLNLLSSLQRELGLTYLFITHDLSVVRYLSHRVSVMYLGQIVETAATDELFAEPQHPYTQALLAAVPSTDPEHRRVKAIVEGDVPSPANPPSGCRFHPRCPYVMERCKSERPALYELRSGRTSRCFLSEGEASS